MKRFVKLLIAALTVSVTSIALGAGDEFKEPINVLAEDGRQIRQLPAERFRLPFEEERGDARLGVTKAGHVYVALGKQLCWSEDGGRSWKHRNLPWSAGGFGVLRDDTFILFGGYPKCWVTRSTDYGRTWSQKAPLDPSPFTSCGGGWTQISQPPGCPALMVITLRNGTGRKDHEGIPLPAHKLGIHDYIYRSTDSGRTWGDTSLIVPDSAESSLLLLKSGKMLAAIRKQRVPQRLLPGENVFSLKAIGAWRESKPFVKHGVLADSDDKGHTWHRERLGPVSDTINYGLCPSELVQLPDQRVVWIYTRKFGDDTTKLLGPGQGIYARVSADEGATWSGERYCVRLLKQPGYTPYPATTVLSDGTILTVMGTNRGANPAMAIRWRPAPE
jgi:hypothetical protein